VLIAFLTLPYALTRATIYPPFYFDIPGIWLVANMLALEALALHAYAKRNRINVKPFLRQSEPSYRALRQEDGIR
jgi:hypothetical protein